MDEVEAYQDMEDLQVDGSVGPETWGNFGEWRVDYWISHGDVEHWKGTFDYPAGVNFRTTKYYYIPDGAGLLLSASGCYSEVAMEHDQPFLHYWSGVACIW